MGKEEKVNQMEQDRGASLEYHEAADSQGKGNWRKERLLPDLERLLCEFWIRWQIRSHLSLAQWKTKRLENNLPCSYKRKGQWEREWVWIRFFSMKKQLRMGANEHPDTPHHSCQATINSSCLGGLLSLTWGPREQQAQKDQVGCRNESRRWICCERKDGWVRPPKGSGVLWKPEAEICQRHPSIKNLGRQRLATAWASYMRTLNTGCFSWPSLQTGRASERTQSFKPNCGQVGLTCEKPHRVEVVVVSQGGYLRNRKQGFP